MNRFIIQLVASIVLLMTYTALGHAQVCTPNLTPEQAFLSLKNPTQPSATADPFANVPKRININTATEAELSQLDGIGANKAQAIILYREMIAPFTSVDDLARVKGIGKATVDKNRHQITTQ